MPPDNLFAFTFSQWLLGDIEMGFGGISIWQLLIVLGIIILIFGTKKLRNIGGDLGGAVKGFKKAMHEDENAKEADQEDPKQIAKDDATFAESSRQSSDATVKKQEQKTSEKS